MLVAASYRSKTGTSTTRCCRSHIFGQPVPSPFDSGIINPSDGGPPLDSGGGLNGTSGQSAPAIWVIGRTSDTCVKPA
jgi:hypothetical protein